MTMMLLEGIKIPGALPEGWHRPKWLYGFARPMLRKENKEILKHFTPHGTYCIKPHPDLQVFYDWLKCPTWYNYTDARGGKCGSSIGGKVDLGWFSADGPILLTLPDIASIKADMQVPGYTLTDKALDWTPPKGLRETCEEEWAFMVAEHKWKTKKAQG